MVTQKLSSITDNYANTQGLLAFCKRNNKIICYGAANYGCTVKHFLENQDIYIDYFLVSDKVPGLISREGVPVIAIDCFKEPLEKYGIILSLTEKYHKKIEAKLINKAKKQIDIFKVDAVLWTALYENLMNLRIERNLLKKKYEKKQVINYEQKAKVIENKYKYVKIDYADFGALGAMGGWVQYYCYYQEKTKHDFYQLYYPYTAFEQNQSLDLKGDNAFLLSKLDEDGITAVTEKNIDFWRYYVQTRPNKIKIHYKIDPYKITADPEIARLYATKMNYSKRKYVSFSNEEELFGNHEIKKFHILVNCKCKLNTDIIKKHYQ